VTRSDSLEILAGSLVRIWPQAVAIALVVLAMAASAHAVLSKRDSRSVIAWVGLIWLAPLVGSSLYALLGVNRIHRRAHAMRGARLRVLHDQMNGKCEDASSDMLAHVLPAEARHLTSLARLVHEVTGTPPVAGNRVTPLFNGEQAYPSMLEVIDSARHTIAFSTYIFSSGATGHRFVEALKRAVNRKVEVRVLIDDVGARYSLPSIVPSLRQAGVPVARFLPALLPVKLPYFNLRNHRKILIADGRAAFTGGMNIQESAHFRFEQGSAIQDLHFRVEGPVVSHLQHVFADDWRFTTEESLKRELWFPEIQAQGDVVARGIPNGPDDNSGTLRLAILGALACARSSVRIVTPYFLPDDAIINALNIAAMRGVSVDILLPSRNNLRLVQWASTALLWQLLERGCRIWLSPPPFDHSKLLVVDHAWTLLGSSNWDPRSLRLNFEFDLECYDPALSLMMEASIDAKLRVATPLSLAQVNGRCLPVRLRDGVSRLFTPYL